MFKEDKLWHVISSAWMFWRASFELRKTTFQFSG